MHIAYLGIVAPISFGIWISISFLAFIESIEIVESIDRLTLRVVLIILIAIYCLVHERLIVKSY